MRFNVRSNNCKPAVSISLVKLFFLHLAECCTHCELQGLLIPADSGGCERCFPRQSFLWGVYDPGHEDSAQARVELLQLLPPQGLSVRETALKIISASELLLEQHEAITALKFFISVPNTVWLGMFLFQIQLFCS